MSPRTTRGFDLRQVASDVFRQTSLPPAAFAKPDRHTRHKIRGVLSKYSDDVVRRLAPPHYDAQLQGTGVLDRAVGAVIADLATVLQPRMPRFTRPRGVAWLYLGGVWVDRFRLPTLPFYNRIPATYRAGMAMDLYGDGMYGNFVMVVCGDTCGHRHYNRKGDDVAFPLDEAWRRLRLPT